MLPQGAQATPVVATGEEVPRKLIDRAAILPMNHVKTYTITLIPAAHGRNVHAVCHALPDCAATGKDKREALELIEDQIKVRIADEAVHGRPVPVDRTSTKFLWINVEEFLV